jgi:hypothetical protein
MAQDPDPDPDADLPAGLTSMEELAAMTHELLITLQTAGFTHGEAFQLVSNLLNQLMVEGIRQTNMGRPATGA